MMRERGLICGGEVMGGFNALVRVFRGRGGAGFQRISPILNTASVHGLGMGGLPSHSWRFKKIKTFIHIL